MAKELDINDPELWEDVPAIEVGIGETFKFEEIGQVVIGEYLGIATLDTDDGEAPYHQFRMGNGEVTAVSSSYDLQRKLAEVSEGSPVRIEYLRDQETARDQTPMKVFKVQARL